VALFLIALTAPVRAAVAHDGQPLAPHDLWGAWGSDPLALVGIGLAALFYARGVGALWRRAGRGRGVSRGQVAAGAGGLVALALALLSPLDRLSSALLSAHMSQHLLLILVAAPLLVLGWPPAVALWALPAPARRAVASGWRRAGALRRAWRAMSRPAAAWTLPAVALWAWHLPVLYQAALRSWPLHALEHAAFLGTAALFWSVVVRCGTRGGLEPGLGLLYVLTAGVESGLLGALMALDDAAWYPTYGATAPVWGRSALEDQRLAGLLMWVPAGSAYLVAAVALLSRWATADQRGRRLTVESADGR
jgi:putative membrane protein